MIGKSLSHYRIVAELGRGGMGIVFKAEDTRLDRSVALKVLPPDMLTSQEDRARFYREARSAASVSHPNICHVYEVDEGSIDDSDEKRLFIAMEYIEGETLADRIARGQLDVEEVLRIAIEFARALAAAHSKSVVHRDIKPANLMVENGGRLLLLDFGLAKLVGTSDLTQGGTTLGTLAYMSPEQASGHEVDHRTDIWSLGAVIYELLAGCPPFEADYDAALIYKIVNESPEPISERRSGIPPEFADVVTKCLSSSLEERYSSAVDLVQALDRIATPQVARSNAGHGIVKGRSLLVAASLVSVLVVVSLWVRANSRASKMEWLQTEIIPELNRLVGESEYLPAFRLVEEVSREISDDSLIHAYREMVAIPRSGSSDPPGATVSYRSALDKDDAWTEVGITPLTDVWIPIDELRWRLEWDGEVGFEGLATGPAAWRMAERSSPENMVRVPGGTIGFIALGNYGSPADNDEFRQAAVPEFWIDRFEVSNAEFKEFVDAGGYDNPGFWTVPVVLGNRQLAFEESRSLFVDETGRPGPAFWQVGDYEAGKENHPVSGVSWYEAAAYAEFRGKQLPTLYHWLRAAGTGRSSAIIPVSNLDSEETLPVGLSDGIGPFGTYDTAGNVREWCWNDTGGQRFALGGAFSDPVYMFSFNNVQSPLDRLEQNGIRLISTSDVDSAAVAELGKRFRLVQRDYSLETPVSDEVFNIYKNQFAYDATPLDVEFIASDTTEDYVIESVTVRPAYDDADRLIIHVYLPRNSRPPYQAVIHYPGSGDARDLKYDPSEPSLGDFIQKSGRVLVKPVLYATRDRYDGKIVTWPSETHAYSDYVIRWTKDFRRTIDYLESRGDIDVNGIAYLGTSWGGRMGAIIPAVEPRIKANVLFIGGLASGVALPEVDQINYITRVRQPTLMLNGRYDPLEPLESAQIPMYNRLGTPVDEKEHVLYDLGHAVDQIDAIRRSLDWLDRYLGPVNR